MRKQKSGMSRMALETGFGSRVWSVWGYLAAKYYHPIIGVFVALILYFSLVPYYLLRWALIPIVLYLLYYLIRHLIPSNFESKFYDARVQLVRAQVGILGIFGLMYWASEYDHYLHLWVLFIPSLLIISRHCTTLTYFLSIIEICVMIFVVRWGNGQPVEFIRSEFWFSDPELMVRGLSLIFVAFLLHFLMRNIDAWDDILNTFETLETLGQRSGNGKLPTEKWEAVLDTYLPLVGGTCGTIWLCDHNTRRIQALTDFRYCPSQHCTLNNLCDLTALDFEADHPLAYVARTGRPTFCQSKIEQSENWWSFRDDRSGTMCILPDGIFSRIAVPIVDNHIDGTQPLGILCIDFEKQSSPRPHLLHGYYQFLSGLARRVRPILNHVKQMQEMNTLQQIGQRVSRNLKQKSIVKEAVEVIVDILGFEYTVISRVDPLREKIEAVDGRNVPPEWIQASSHDLDSNDIQADIVRTGRQEIFDKWDTRFDPVIWEQFGHHELIRVFTPIVGQDGTGSTTVWGTIESGYSKNTRPRISDEQVDMLAKFAQHLFIALTNSDLFTKTQRRADHLARLHHIGWEVARARSDNDLATVLYEAGRNLREILDADIIMIYHYNRNSQSLEEPHVFGEIKGLEKQPLRIPSPQEGIIAKILSSREPVYIPDVDKNPLLMGPSGDYSQENSNRRTFTQRQGIKSFAGVPMLASGKKIGVLCVNYRKRHTFSRNHRQVLEIAAQFAAVALYNTEINEVREELITSRERERLASQLHHSLTQYLPSIRFLVETAQTQLSVNPSKVTDNLTKIGDVAVKAAQEVRIHIFDLHVNNLTRYNLKDVLKEYVNEARMVFDLDVKLNTALNHHATGIPLPVAREALVVCREGIANTVKYAQASHLTVSLESDLECLHINIEDDGCGFDLCYLDKRGRHGLAMMKDRVTQLKGRTNIISRPGAGTTIQVALPLNSIKKD